MAEMVMLERLKQTNVDVRKLSAAELIKHPRLNKFNVAEYGKPTRMRAGDAEMAKHVDAYVNYCLDLGPDCYVERRVSFAPWVPGNFGIIDHLAIVKTKRKTRMYVTDLKYGQGEEVDAKENRQLMLYALGALEEFSLNYEIDEIILRVFQPRRENYPEHRMKRESLLRWGPFYRAKHQQAQQPDAPLVPGEKQCRFCDYLPHCRAAYEHTFALLAGEFDVVDEIQEGTMKANEIEELDVADLARVLENENLITKFLSKVGSRALEIAQSGGEVPGFKLVRGNSNRAWKDDKKVLEVLKSMSLKRDQIYNIKLNSPAQMEKAAGPRQMKKLDTHIVKPPGKPKLAPLSDKREPIPSIDDEFENEDGLADLDLDLGDDGFDLEL